MKFIAYLKAHTALIATATVIVILGGGYYAYKATRPVSYTTVVVHPGAFVRQVSVSGKVTPAHDVDLGFTQSGRVARVYASVGERVSSGTVLASLDNGDLAANLAQKQAALQAQQAKLESLKAGTRPEEIAVAQAAVDSDQVALTQASLAIGNAIQDAYTRADDAVRNKTYQFVSNPRGISPTVTFLVNDSQAQSSFEGAIPGVEHALVSWQSAIAAGSSDSSAIALAQSNLQSVSSLLSKASGVLTHAIANPPITAANLASYTADINTARSSINTAMTNLTTAVTAQKSAAAALAQAEANLALQKAGTVQSDVDAQAAQVASAQADVASAQAQLGRTMIVAPFSGLVTTVDAKVGLIASPNTPLISIIGNGTFQIESYMPEVNVASVHAGQEAAVTLDAYGAGVTFPARVVSIDPAETIRDGVSTYRTVLEFTNDDDRVKAGMTANVMITTDKRDGVISVPEGVVGTKDGSSYVMVLENGTATQRTVTTGTTSSLGTIEITSGLHDGDVVILTNAS